MKTQIILRVPISLKEELKKVSAFEGMTLNGFVTSELHRVVEKKKKHYTNM